MTLEDQRYSDDNLLEFGRRAAAIRVRIRQRAFALELEEEKARERPENDFNDLFVQYQRSYTRKKDITDTSTPASIHKQFPNALTRKRFSKSELTFEQQKAIIRMFQFKEYTAADIAFKFQVKQRLVYSIHKKYKTDSSFFDQQPPKVIARIKKKEAVE